MKIEKIIQQIPQHPNDYSFGRDIDVVHKLIFSLNDKNEIEALFRKWAARNQPCVFGKLASRSVKGLDYHLTIVTHDLLYGDLFKLFTYIQEER